MPLVSESLSGLIVSSVLGAGVLVAGPVSFVYSNESLLEFQEMRLEVLPGC